MYDVISNSAEETLALGRKIAPLLKKGDVLVMTGDLGAGKTLFTTGILDFYEKKDGFSINSNHGYVHNNSICKNRNIHLWWNNNHQ